MYINCCSCGVWALFYREQTRSCCLIIWRPEGLTLLKSFSQAHWGEIKLRRRSGGEKTNSQLGNSSYLCRFRGETSLKLTATGKICLWMCCRWQSFPLRRQQLQPSQTFFERMYSRALFYFTDTERSDGQIILTGLVPPHLTLKETETDLHY